jgi:hypothetical protein
VWEGLTQIDKAALGNPGAYEPRISGDGLTLTFVGGSPVQVPYQATRASRAVPFAGATPLAGWPVAAATVQDFWIELGGTEILVTSPNKTTNESDMFVSTLAGGQWSVPTTLGSGINSPTATSSNHSVTEDGTLLVYARNDGPTIPIAGKVWHLYQATRSAPVAPGTPFGAATALLLPPPFGDSDELLCPVLSADGTRLLFSSTYPDVVTAANIDHVLKVYYSTKTPTGWSVPVHVAQLDSATLGTCPRSITADGCELYFDRFQFTSTTNELWTAHRTPAP